MERKYLNSQFWKYILPSMFTMLLSGFYSIVDGLFVGNSVGNDALAAINLVYPIQVILNASAIGIGIGGAVALSYFSGRDETKSADRSLGSTITLLIVAGIVLSTVLFFATPTLLEILGASGTIYEYAYDYIFVILCGGLLPVLGNGLSPLIRNYGKTIVATICMSSGLVTNIVLDPIFIFVFNMGVNGAAWATIISQTISAIWAFQFLLSKKTVLRLRKDCMKIEKDILVPCIGLGVAPFIMQSTESVLVLCFNSSLLAYGGDLAVGAMTILSSVMQFAMLPLQGMTQGGQPIISYNYGAEKLDRVKSAFKLQLMACFIYALALWLLAMFVPSLFAMIFTSDPNLVEITSWALRIYLFAIPMMGIQVACQQTFIAFGNSKTSAFLAIFRKLIVLIPLIYILPMILTDKVFAVFLAEPIADTIAAVTTATLFYISLKKMIRTKNQG